MIIPAVIAFAAVCLIAVLAVWAACRKLLKKNAIKLLSAELPDGFFKAKKRTDGREKGLYTSLLKRNIFSDLPRVIITMASIAGCCILLVTGFSMKQSYVELAKRQFGQILDFDMLAFTLNQNRDEVPIELSSVLIEENAKFAPIYFLNSIAQIDDINETIQIICADPERLQAFVHLRDTEANRKILLPERGIVISSGVADEYGLIEGDTINVIDERGIPIEVVITDIYRNYAGRFMFMSSDYASTKFDWDVRSNAFLIDAKNSNVDDLHKKILQMNEKTNCIITEQMRLGYIDGSKIMDLVIIACIIMASIMAAVVLANLINIQLIQKKRELIIMRINGYSTRQTVMYILRENIVTTAAGILVGLALGSVAARATLQTINNASIQMISEIMPQPLIYAVLITILFAAVINWIVLRKIRSLKLTDINK